MYIYIFGSLSHFLTVSLSHCLALSLPFPAIDMWVSSLRSTLCYMALVSTVNALALSYSYADSSMRRYPTLAPWLLPFGSLSLVSCHFFCCCRLLIVFTSADSAPLDPAVALFSHCFCCRIYVNAHLLVICYATPILATGQDGCRRWHCIYLTSLHPLPPSLAIPLHSFLCLNSIDLY